MRDTVIVDQLNHARNTDHERGRVDDIVLDPDREIAPVLEIVRGEVGRQCPGTAGVEESERPMGAGDLNCLVQAVQYQNRTV